MIRTIALTIVVEVDDEDVEGQHSCPGGTFDNGFDYVRTYIEQDDFWWDATAKVLALSMADSTGRKWTYHRAAGVDVRQ